MMLKNILNKLSNNKNEDKPFSGKVICIKSDSCFSENFTVGKIYRFKHGMVIDNEGYCFGSKTHPYTLKDFQQNKFFNNEVIQLLPILK